MDLPVEEFISRLKESGLATSEEIQSWLAVIAEPGQPKSGDELAGKLVARQLLTPFQAQSLVEPVEHPLALGQYNLLECIGQGGTGTVYRALHRHMRREVAIKILHAELAESPEALRRFEREMLAGGKLNHPHIVSTLDAAHQDETLFLVMEYIPGTDLATFVNTQGPMSVDQAVRIIIQAAEGLAYAHDQGIVHRDVKPGNLLLDRQGNARILDLGLARFISTEGQTDLTGTGDMFGTVDYMSPEQALHLGQATSLADIYSLGCTLFFLLTGRAPFEGETVMTRLLAHRDSPVPSIHELRPTVPGALDAVVHKMLAKRPEDRYQTMWEVAKALEPFAGRQSFRPRRLAARILALATVAAVMLAAVPLALYFGWFAESPTNQTREAPALAIAPFTEQQASSHQDAWAGYLGIPVEIENSLGMTFRLIPPGEFMQGADEQEIAESSEAMNRAADADGPQHRVRLTRPFYLGVHEVTQSQYEAVTGVNPSAHLPGGSRSQLVTGLDTQHFPVEMVSWIDAVNFCNALSARENRGTCYQVTDDVVTIVPGDGYRLPTEAEWEFTCRAGTETPWSCEGDWAEIERHGWFVNNCQGRVHAVGQLRANALGLYDLHGNLWEWCQDFYKPQDYIEFAGQTLVDPTGPEQGTVRCMRGGVWNDTHWLGRSAHRGANQPATRNESIGLRVVLTIP